MLVERDFMQNIVVLLPNVSLFDLSTSRWIRMLSKTRDCTKNPFFNRLHSNSERTIIEPFSVKFFRNIISLEKINIGQSGQLMVSKDKFQKIKTSKEIRAPVTLDWS